MQYNLLFLTSLYFIAFFTTTKQSFPILALPRRDANGLSGLDYVVQVITYLLDPRIPQNSAVFVGKLINSLVIKVSTFFIMSCYNHVSMVLLRYTMTTLGTLCTNLYNYGFGFMAHENDDEQRPTKRRHLQGKLDETELLSLG